MFERNEGLSEALRVFRTLGIRGQELKKRAFLAERDIVHHTIKELDEVKNVQGLVQVIEKLTRLQTFPPGGPQVVILDKMLQFALRDKSKDQHERDFFYEEIKAHYQFCIENHYSYVFLNNKMISCAGKCDDLEFAGECYRSALETKHADPATYSSYMDALFNANDHEGANKIYQYAMEVGQSNWLTHTIVMHRAFSFKEGKRAYQIALQRKETDPDGTPHNKEQVNALHQAAIMLGRKMGDYDFILKAYERIANPTVHTHQLMLTACGRFLDVERATMHYESGLALLARPGGGDPKSSAHISDTRDLHIRQINMLILNDYLHDAIEKYKKLGLPPIRPKNNDINVHSLSYAEAFCGLFCFLTSLKEGSHPFNIYCGTNKQVFGAVMKLYKVIKGVECSEEEEGIIKMKSLGKVTGRENHFEKRLSHKPARTAFSLAELKLPLSSASLTTTLSSDPVESPSTPSATSLTLSSAGAAATPTTTTPVSSSTLSKTATSSSSISTVSVRLPVSTMTTSVTASSSSSTKKPVVSCRPNEKEDLSDVSSSSIATSSPSTHLTTRTRKKKDKWITVSYTKKKQSETASKKEPSTSHKKRRKKPTPAVAFNPASTPTASHTETKQEATTITLRSDIVEVTPGKSDVPAVSSSSISPPTPATTSSDNASSAKKESSTASSTTRTTTRIPPGFSAAHLMMFPVLQKDSPQSRSRRRP